MVQQQSNMNDITFITCSSCGANGMEYLSGSSELQCSYCGNRQKIIDFHVIYEYTYDVFIQHKESTQVDTNNCSIQCPVCGGINNFRPFDVADYCSYCGTHLTWVTSSKNPIFQPQAIQPFMIPKSHIIKKVAAWMHQKSELWYVPSTLCTLFQPEFIEGVYVPFWTFDMSTRNWFHVERGDYITKHTYTFVNKIMQSHHVRRTIQWQSVKGSFDCNFDDILIIASNLLPQKNLNKLLRSSYNPQELKPYNSQYLAGFRVARYSVPLTTAYNVAQSIADSVIKVQIKHIVGGDKQRIKFTKTHYSNRTFKHILLPLWILRYRYFGRYYYVAISGIDGSVLGNYPLSMGAIILAFTIVATIIVILLLM